MAELERCEMCKTPALKCERDVVCHNSMCEIIGPADDPTGAKWNEMQRMIRAGLALAKLEQMQRAHGATSWSLRRNGTLSALRSPDIGQPSLLDAIEKAEEE